MRTRALQEGYKVGQKVVGADMVENVLAKDIDGLEPRLTRNGIGAAAVDSNVTAGFAPPRSV
jgi:hypothetical protein